MEYKNNVVNGYVLSKLQEGPLPGFAAFTRKVAAEGIVMLRNRDQLLPLKPGTRVSLFGRVQLNYIKSGSGSGGMVNVDHLPNIIDSLRATGKVQVNETLAKIYADWVAENPFNPGQGWGDEPSVQEEMPLKDEWVKDAAEHSDVAIVVISRVYGEGKDSFDSEGHYRLTADERNILHKVKRFFKHVCVLLNVSSVLDMKWSDEFDIDAILYLWCGGTEGAIAAAEVLTGEVSPSGKLSDTVVRNIEDYPSYHNFGDNETILYQEDIYVGYRYFETVKPEAIVYPFGFGLSYTTFDVSFDHFCTFDGSIHITATVKNTGKYTGKEVVQVYYGAPQGKLGKPLRQLGAFHKTADLKPGESESYELSFPIADMASYDDSGITGHKSCYVLEAGEYPIYAGTDSHSAALVGSYKLDTLTVTQKLTEANAPILPFTRMHPVERDGKLVMEYEDVPLRTVDVEKRIASELPEDIPYTGDRGIKLIDVAEGRATLTDFIAQLNDLELACLCRGEGMCSPKVTPGTGCAYGGTTNALLAYGIPTLCGTDGPTGLRMDCGAQATAMPIATLLACTWNEQLVEEMFVYEGIEMTAYKIDTLLGPGMNIHRLPLNGRNFEYFSEDPLLTGKMAAAVCRGLNRVGGVTGTIKHFIANNQEIGRDRASSTISERAIREIYTKGFRIAVQEGNARALMTSYGKLNGLHTSCCYDLNTTLLRKEWGFTGFVMTDWWARVHRVGEAPSNTDLANMVHAQNDVYMVTEDVLTKKDNLLESLQNGFLKHGEIQRSAMNVCRYIMQSHTFERFIANGGKMENGETMDPSKLSVKLTFTDIKHDETIEMPVQEAGKYLCVITMHADADELAQLPFNMYVNRVNAMSANMCGTNGKTTTFAREISLMNGTLRFMFSYPELMHVEKIELLK